MTIDRILDGGGESHILFYDPVFVRKIMPNVSKVFVDAMFQITPRLQGVSQLLTLMVVSHDHVSLKSKFENSIIKLNLDHMGNQKSHGIPKSEVMFFKQLTS